MLDLDYLQKVLFSYQLDLLQEPGLDKNRLQKIIKSAGLDLSGRPLTKNEEDEGRCYRFWATIGRALEFWESDFSTFLDILEKEDLDTVIENDYLLNYLQDYAPLFSLRELETITESLIRHQEANRESLIAHGYPTSSFEDSSWHSKLLSNLYYLTLSPEEERLYSNLFSNFPEEEVVQTLSEKDIDQLKLIRPKLFDLKIRHQDFHRY